MVIVMGASFLLLLGLLSLAFHQNEAGLVGATLAIGTSGLVVVLGLLYLVVTRRRDADEQEPPAGKRG